MSAKASANAVSYPPNRTDSMIGAGARIDGHVTFTGVLRVQGEIQGDITGQTDSRDAIVVDSSGSVTGTVTAPHVIVKGKVAGPMASSQTVEVYQGAHIVGDIVYRHLDVHAGGVIDGLMTPSALAVEEAAAVGDHASVDSSVTPEIHEYGQPFAQQSNLIQRSRVFLKPGFAIAAAVVIAIVVWPTGEASKPTKPAVTDQRAPNGELKADAGLKADANRQAVLKPQASEPTKVEMPTPATSDPVSRGNDSAAAELTGSGEGGTAGASRFVTVEGVNPSRPTGVFLLVSKDASVLYKKKLDDASLGQRIDMAAGEKVSVAIASDEILRVAKGRDVSIFYQGRKVPPKTVESGVWMKFVPHPSSKDRD